MIKKNSVVKIQNLVVNQQSRPAKTTPASTEISSRQDPLDELRLVMTLTLQLQKYYIVSN